MNWTTTSTANIPKWITSTYYENVSVKYTIKK